VSAALPPCRTVFVSDVHLGSRHCHAAELCEFLERLQCERLYLVGDIVDLWWMAKRRAAWGSAHNRVVEALHALSRQGTELIYVPGNHDRAIRRFCGLMLPAMQVRRRAIHVTADGRRLLVIHGDQFDVITRYHRWLAFLGDSAYEITLTLNRWLNHWRSRYGYGYWSLSAYLKHKVKGAVNFISDFEQAIVHECAKRGFNGVVCGHIHHAEIRPMGEVEYMNCGDWVESCTALIEHLDGRIELYRLADDQARQAQLQVEQVAAVEPVA
jgi:UDP-2,3-diacylglucosamine pyrophosphatase LpxH